MRTVPRELGRNWQTDIVKPENVCTGEPAMALFLFAVDSTLAWLVQVITGRVE